MKPSIVITISDNDDSTYHVGIASGDGVTSIRDLPPTLLIAGAKALAAVGVTGGDLEAAVAKSNNLN